jgi:transcriptional regulator with XRE-family HTH domain
MQASMKERGVTLVDVARAAGVSYEHARRLARGLTPPSHALTEVLSRVLGFNAADAWDAAQSDRLLKKFGLQLERTVSNGEHPRIHECSKMLIALTPVQYQAVLSILRGFAGHQTVTHSLQKAQKPSLLVHEHTGRKFRKD